MMTLSMFSFLVGAVLGQRFKIIVLIPAFAILLSFAVGTGLAHAQTGWSIVLLAIAAAISLQTGYLFGIFVHHILTTASSKRSSSLTSTNPARHAAP